MILRKEYLDSGRRHTLELEIHFPRDPPGVDLVDRGFGHPGGKSANAIFRQREIVTRGREADAGNE
jgi:hypothetical protein